MKKNLRGFTLIEMLIVVSISVLFATTAYLTFQNAQKNSRDQQRKTDLAQLRSALETYSLRNNKYPDETFNTDACDSSIGGASGGCGGSASWHSSSNLQILVTQGILNKLPVDPKNTSPYIYIFELDQVGEGVPACPGSGDTACRYILQTLMENTEYNGGRGECIYTVQGGDGIPNGGVSPPADCEGNVVPTGWSGKPCCK